MNNYPPGMRESDIPGFNDIDAVRDIDCPLCGAHSEEVDVTLSPGLRRYSDLTIYTECPECEEQIELTEECEIPDWVTEGKIHHGRM